MVRPKRGMGLGVGRAFSYIGRSAGESHTVPKGRWTGTAEVCSATI